MQILIALVQTPTGKLEVQGPVDNLIQSLGLLEAAKVIVVEHNAAKAKANAIVPVAAMPPGLHVVNGR